MTLSSYPVLNPYDEAAITAVLEALVANQPPPRIDVVRTPNGRLRILGKVAPREPGQITGHHVWYCCMRYGRAVPVREVDGVRRVEISRYDVPAYDRFSSAARPFELYNAPPADVTGGWSQMHESAMAYNSAFDGWRETYDAALGALL